MKYNANDIELSVLYDIGEQIIERYKEQLKLDNTVASGDLLNSIEWNIAKKDENTLTLEMQLFDYWYFVEYGRKKTDRLDTPWETPVEDISRWIINKIRQGKFIPKPDKQIPTTQQEIKKTAYAIVQKIHEVGYYGDTHYGKHPLENSLKKSIADGLVEKFCNAVGGELANEIVVELKQIETRPIPKPKRIKTI